MDKTLRKLTLFNHSSIPLYWPASLLHIRPHRTKSWFNPQQQLDQQLKIFKMRSSIIATSFSTLLSTVSATGGLLPLYLYPSAVWNDGAALWKPAIDAIAAYPSVQWLAVVNPHNGPGLSGLPGDNDVNYISGVSQLNAHSNVKTIGYVRTQWSTSSMDELKKNITTWKNWSTYTASNIGVRGIFFDEASDNYAYLSQAVNFARSTFGSTPITTICNFGTTAPATYYNLCDVVIAFESCLNCSEGPQYKDQATITANIPTSVRSKAAIIVRNFFGTAYDGSAANAALLTKYISTIKSNAVGWAYLTSSTDYRDITTAPGNVGANAKALA